MSPAARPPERSAAPATPAPGATFSRKPAGDPDTTEVAKIHRVLWSNPGQFFSKAQLKEATAASDASVNRAVLDPQVTCQAGTGGKTGRPGLYAWRTEEEPT